MTKEDIIIRRLVPEEREAAHALAWKVFQEYESPDYSKEGTEEFAKCLKDEKYLEGMEYFGAFYDSTLAGIIAIRMPNRHICFFFVDGQYHRKGIGRKLFSYVYEEYGKETITLNSSPYGLPFYKAIGFTAASDEQEINGIRFTPMLHRGQDSKYEIVKLADRQELKNQAAKWFKDKWGIPEEAYAKSIEDSFTETVPSWYVCLEGERIIAGMGVIENDFHERKDLTPNVCAVYTDMFYRRQGLAGKLLDTVCRDMASQGIDTLYLLTNHDSFYERYNWKFHCMVTGDGEEEPSRMYVHHAN